MNEVINKLYNKRSLWVESSKENNFDKGINNLLTELYPNNAHFIYELLQNAEDTGATKVIFELKNDELIFKHNGRAFDEKDIDGITSIGQGTKKDDINKIGKFGVGFKAVFSYTDTPIIHSGDFHFKITDLVIPNEIENINHNTNETIMIFPFNNSDKNPNIAYQEIKRGLENIKDNTLLFLNNINTITYIIDNNKNEIKRIHIDKNLISISNNKKQTKTTWIRFKKNLPKSDKLFVSIAYKLEKDKKQNNTIVPISGEVSIYFPAEKEVSNLKFHIHAPFASTVARDSIKELKENEDLRDLISDLVCESLEYIKANNLLNFNFLSCLPIEDDNLAEFYKTIQEKLIETFNNKPYVIIENSKNMYQPANKCVRASKEIKSLIKIDFLKILMQIDEELFYTKNPLNSSREDKFLQQLAIRKITNDDIVENLDDTLDSYDYLDSEDEENFNKFKKAILKNSDKWFGKLYSYLYEKNFYNNKIIKLTNDSLNLSGGKCYFSNRKLKKYNIVKKETYTLNDEKTNQKAILFLEENLDVKEIGEKEQIEQLLNDKYSSNQELKNKKNYLKDFIKFINYYEKTKDSSIFKNKSIILDEQNILRKATDCLLDKPYINSKMKLLKNNNYFQSKFLSLIIDKYLISSIYHNKMNNELLIHFFKKLGVIYELTILKSNRIKKENNKLRDLKQDYLKYNVKEIWHTKIEEDFYIEKLSFLLKQKNRDISLLIWKTLIKANKEVLKAKYRPNRQYEIRFADSVLVQILKEYHWIPDTKNNFYKPQDISKDMLPDDFIYNNTNGWLDAINFGENIKKRQKEYQEANKLVKEKTGFDLEDLEELKNAGYSKEDLKKLAKDKKQQELRESLEKNQSDGNSKPFIESKDNETIITNDKKYQEATHTENKNNKNNFTLATTNYKKQDSKEIEKIKDFLYKEYEGHCQICGDTFAYKDKNVYKIKSLNIGKNRDINRYGNTLCLCHKHHDIFDKKLQKNEFLEFIKNKDKIDIEYINEVFNHYDWVSKDDINEVNDAFYRIDEDDNFSRDEVYFLPIKLFGKREYIKFTKAHIFKFIEVYNEN